MEHLRKFIATARQIKWAEIDFQKDKAQDKFEELWPDMRELFLAFKDMNITGNRLDKRLQKLVRLGDHIKDGDRNKWTKFQSKLDRVWNRMRIPLRMAILAAQLFERYLGADSDRVDKAENILTQFIEIGEWMTVQE
jgi:hypothetical protein